MSRERPQVLIPEERRPTRYAGLMTLVSHPPIDGKKQPPYEAVLLYHLADGETNGASLHVCWLIASAGEKGTVSEALRIRELYGTRCRILIKELRDVFDVQEALPRGGGDLPGGRTRSRDWARARADN
ncbi:hypothetical protein KFU94_26595 [Chloroflexi bacterium TSY]|nr:hypothetical protein [Chloroflexi bacterium TSY]